MAEPFIVKINDPEYKPKKPFKWVKWAVIGNVAGWIIEAILWYIVLN